MSLEWGEEKSVFFLKRYAASVKVAIVIYAIDLPLATRSGLKAAEIL